MSVSPIFHPFHTLTTPLPRGPFHSFQFLRDSLFTHLYCISLDIIKSYGANVRMPFWIRSLVSIQSS